MVRLIYGWLVGAIIVLIAWPLEGNAQKLIVLDNSFDSLILGTYVEFLPDPDGQWALDDLLKSERQQQFQKHDSDILSKGFTKTVYWLRFTLENPLTETQVWLLDFPFLTMDWVELHRPLPSGSYEMVRTGDAFPLESRDVLHQNYLFELQIPPQQQQVFYFRVNSRGGAMVAPLILSKPTTFFLQVKQQETIWGLFFGFLGLLVIYSFFQYLSIKDKGYLYYTLSVMSACFIYLIFSGWGSFYVWPQWAITINNYLPEFLIVAPLFYLLYCQALLDTKTHLPRIHLILKITSFAGGACLILFLFSSYFIRIQVANVYMLWSLVITVPASILRYRQKYEPALYPLIGAVAIATTTGINSYRTAYGEGSTSGLDATVLAGILIDTFMLSFALNSRYKLLRLEKEQAQQDKLKMQATLVEELERTDQLKDDFLANTSHELSTPLHGIIGLCQAMERRDNPLPYDEQLKNLNLIENSARRLSHLVNDILDFSRVKNQDLQLRLRCIEVQSSLHLVSSLCESSIGQKPIEIVKQFPKDPIYVNADEARLQQILFNLVSNAIKFTHEGQIVLQTRRHDQHVEVSVSDTGIGIADEKQKAVFQPFTQADGSISREYGGTGLGLSISQQLVQLHGSQLEMESVVGQGTRFFFDLPLASEDTLPEKSSLLDKPFHLPSLENPETLVPSDSVPASLPTPPENAPTILVVDDEPLNIEILKYQLIQEGYHVQSALDGIEALTSIQQKTPDLILLDLMMPRMNGYEACQKIRERHTKAELPIILLTAKGQMKDLISGLRVGANDYLTKPFYQEELLARIKNQLSQRKAFEIQQENQRLTWHIEQIAQTEAVLKLSEKRLSQALDHAKEAILVVNEAGVVVFQNKSFSGLLGYETDQIINQPLSLLLPNGHTSHSLQWPLTPAHWKNSKTVKQVLLKKQNGDDWTCHVWGDELDLEEETWIFTFASPQSPKEPSIPKISQWIQALGQNRQRLQEFIGILQELPSTQFEDQTEMLEDLNSIDHFIEKLGRLVDPNTPNDQFGTLLVQVMNDSIECWEAETQKGLIELAEESGLWAVNMDRDRLRARSMERYMDLSKLPKNPRWRNVIKTGHFVLTHSGGSSSFKSQLQKSLNQLIQMAHQRNLSPPVDVR